MKIKSNKSANRHNRFVWILLVLTTLTACDAPDNSSKNVASESVFELSSASKNQHFVVTVSTEDQTQPPVGRFHTWLVTITDAQSRPVYPAVVSIGGGMPSHGHGLPTQPQITKYLGQGIYRLEGVKFNMSGAWAIKFRIATQQLQDTVEFDFNVSH